MTLGTTSWTLLGAQGRYRLATTVAFAGSWLVTIPLAVLASVALHLNLEGQTAAVVIGYMSSGTINAYFLFRSDWEKLSLSVIESHESQENDPSQETPKDLGMDCNDEKSVSSQRSSTESTPKVASVSVDVINRVPQALQTP